MDEGYDAYLEAKAEADIDDEFQELFDFIDYAKKEVSDKIGAYIQARDELADLIAEASEIKELADKAKTTLNKRQAEQFKEDYDAMMEALQKDFIDNDMTASLKALKKLGGIEDD